MVVHVPAEQVSQASLKTSPKEGVAGVEILKLGELGIESSCHLVLEKNGNNDTVDGDGLAEDDAERRKWGVE